jgi:membrane-associated PAP2 superfamily phosphatase
VSGLPWVRLDSHIGTNLKIARLLERRNGHRAFTLYVCALGWSGGHGTDGRVYREALAYVHGTETLAALLVELGLWDPVSDGVWSIHDYSERQELAQVTELKRASASRGGRLGNCRRWHEQPCTRPECG